MFSSELRIRGKRYIITVPREEVQRLGLSEGQLVSLELHPAETRPTLTPDLREAFEASWERNEEGYRYLAGR
jgi:hypothetical protein